jgi:hypothetical protein
VSAFSISYWRTPRNYVAARQRAHPAIYQAADGGLALFSAAFDFAPLELTSMAWKGLIAGGEVGELTPTVYVRYLARGSAVIVHSGLMRLLYSAARAMTATDGGQSREEQTPRLTAKHAAGHIAQLFKDVKERWLGTAQVFAATTEQQRWADTIAVHAEVFMLMHELAHIYNQRIGWRRRIGSWRRGEFSQEIAADATACDWLIAYLLNPKPGGPPRQMLYAGAEFALRTWMAMEAAGIQLEDTHPKAGDRVAVLRSKLRAAAGSRTFYAIANTALAFDQMWRAIEQLLRGRALEFELRLEDVLATMRTLTAEYLKDSRLDNLIDSRPSADDPGKMELVFAPKEPAKMKIVAAAREAMAKVEPDVRAQARAHIDDVYEPGSIQSMILLALLKLVEP